LNALLRRLGASLVVVWAVVSLAFAVNTMLPGDPAKLAAGPQARPADVARISTQLGLDKPPIVQYALFWKRLVHVGPPPAEGGQGGDTGGGHASCAVLCALGRWCLHVDFGKSFQLRQPVVDVVAARLPRTAALAVSGLLAQLLFGVSAGTIAALRRGSSVDRFLVAGSLIGISAPTFVIGLTLQYVFAYGLRWLPLDGFGRTFAEHALCLVLPALTLGIYGAAYYARLTRDEMCTLLRSGWVRTARAKGLSPGRVTAIHALRNALLPIVTSVGLEFGSLMGGAVVTETVFRWPGMGELAVKATLNRDGPVILACIIVTSVAIVASNLAVDLVYARMDPRVTARRGPGIR
jgi:peptide/nickel transport system permease protein